MPEQKIITDTSNRWAIFKKCYGANQSVDYTVFPVVAWCTDENGFLVPMVFTKINEVAVPINNPAFVQAFGKIKYLVLSSQINSVVSFLKLKRSNNENVIVHEILPVN